MFSKQEYSGSRIEPIPAKKPRWGGSVNRRTELGRGGERLHVPELGHQGVLVVVDVRGNGPTLGVVTNNFARRHGNVTSRCGKAEEGAIIGSCKCKLSDNGIACINVFGVEDFAIRKSLGPCLEIFLEFVFALDRGISRTIAVGAIFSKCLQSFIEVTPVEAIVRGAEGFNVASRHVSSFCTRLNDAEGRGRKLFFDHTRKQSSGQLPDIGASVQVFSRIKEQE